MRVSEKYRHQEEWDCSEAYRNFIAESILASIKNIYSKLHVSSWQCSPYLLAKNVVHGTFLLSLFDCRRGQWTLEPCALREHHSRIRLAWIVALISLVYRQVWIPCTKSRLDLQWRKGVPALTSDRSRSPMPSLWPAVIWPAGLPLDTWRCNSIVLKIYSVIL